jgi:membrane dipeptidase
VKRSTVLAASLVSVGLLLAACGQGETPPAPTPRPTDEQLHARAVELAHGLLIVDTHIDLPYRLEEEMEDISIRTEKGDYDLPRAREGGLNAPFMSIYVPASYQEQGGARDLADRLIGMVEKFEADWPDMFAVARSTADVRTHFTAGKISLPMGMENGASIEDDLANVRHFHERGIRYITLTHSQNNHICDSSFAEEREWNGLSPFGREVVAEMNRVGMMIDVSHLSDEAASQVLEITRAPVIASHSSARRFTPDWERNISDELIRKVADGGGVVMINFGSAFLDEAANKQSTAFWDLVKEFRESRGIDRKHPDVKAFRDTYWEEHERLYAGLDDVVAHIDHIVKLVGVDHVGFGSDFEGVGDSLPEGLKDVSGYPNIIYELLKKGYSEDDLRKICGENLMRVWTEVERVARMEPVEA